MTKNCIVVDDEPIARDILTKYIGQIPYFNLVGFCSNGLEALELLRSMPVDLIVLDINMPRLNGFEMLRTLKAAPHVIITSAHAEYALEGFELSVTDYLLKPFSFQRFLQATEKIIKSDQKCSSANNPEEVQTHIFVKSDKTLARINLAEVSHIEAYGNYIYIHIGQDKIVSKQTLSDFEKQLPNNSFIRIHKSYIVSLYAIKYLKGNQLFIGEKSIPVGRVYRDSLIAKMI